MGQLLYVRCEDCDMTCPAVPLSREHVNSALNTKDKDIISLTRKILQLKRIVVVCQKTGESKTLSLR